MIVFFSLWSIVTATVIKLYSRNALAHQLSEKPSLELLRLHVEAGNGPLSEGVIAPIVLYIAGNVKVVTSDLDEIVAKSLKMCKGHFMNLCKKYEGLSGIRYSFDIEKSADLKAGLDRFQGDARLISVNDFSTLYTLFEHSHLVSNMTWLLDK